jgi:hypothetical protein
MAVAPTTNASVQIQSVQVINVDVALERQKMLREKLGEFFQTLSEKSKQKKRIIYTLNNEQAPLDQVLKINEEADALFTSFNYDVKVSEEARASQVVSAQGVLGELPPHLRYPKIAEFQRLVDNGFFRHRRLVLVGDLYAKIAQFLKSRMAVQVTIFTDPARTKPSAFIPVTAIEQVTPLADGTGTAGQAIPVPMINSIVVADIPFDGVINMPEVDGRFLLKDATILDTTRKLFIKQGVKEVLTKQRTQDERLTYVRNKRLLVVLDPDLEQIVSERLLFDGMQQVSRTRTLEEALTLLGSGKSQGIVEFFEAHGYDPVFELLAPEERDRFLVGLLGSRVGEYLEREVRAVKPHLTALEGSDLDSLLYAVPPEVLDMVLVEIQKRSYDRFLALVPMKMRDQLILEFLGKAEQVQSAWRGIGEAEKKEIFEKQAALILGHLNWSDSAAFKRRFPNLTFEFSSNYDSSKLSGMSKDEQEATFSLIVKSLEQAKLPPGLLPRALQPPELEKLVIEALLRHPTEFYNRLNPAVRKQIWIIVGREYRDPIIKSLHVLDKIEIIKGVKESSLGTLFDNPAFLQYAKSAKNGELAGQLLLTLKKINAAESKGALLKALVTAADWKPHRLKNIPAMLAREDYKDIYKKLSDNVDTLTFRFDSLLCTKAHYAKLRDQPPLKGAAVTLVDNLVDSSLFKLFNKGAVSMEEYRKMSQNVEQEIQAIRKKMAEREVDDPVSVYVLETMLALNEMSNQAMGGKLTEEALRKLDTRQGVRQRLVGQLKTHVQQLTDFLQKAGKQFAELAQRIAEHEQRVAETTKAGDEAMAKASAIMAETEQMMKLQAQANVDRAKVVQTQKDLSQEFFAIIQPLLLDKVKQMQGLGSSLLRMVGLGKRDEESAAQRLIFKFDDDEIKSIMRYKIVFCTKDEILLQFIVTCLRIDKLENSLFRMATADTLPKHPKDVDILFYGPGYQVADFADVLSEKQLVQFADEAFQQRLIANERLKAKTKQTLGKIEKTIQEKKAQMEALNKEAKGHRDRLRSLTTTLAGMKEERDKLNLRLEHNKERHHHYQGELTLLEQRLADIDGRFTGLKERITTILAGGQGNDESKAKLAQELRDELTKINKDLSRLMFVKGVKDVGDFVSKTTQKQIMQRIDQAERLDLSTRKISRIAVADDGSSVGQTLKRSFAHVAPNYFRLPDSAVEQINIKRLLGRLQSDKEEPYSVVVLITDQPQDNFEELKALVKKVSARMPDAYQMILTPMGEIAKLPPESPALKNILALKERVALVNSFIIDYSAPRNMLQLLQEKAPRG